MKTKIQLLEILKTLHKKSYSAYKILKGTYDYGSFYLHIDHVQGDPYAAPSSMRVEIPDKKHGFPSPYYKGNVMLQEEETVPYILDAKNQRLRKITLEDQILRKFHKELHQNKLSGGKGMGSGKSGQISACPVGQKVLEQVAVILTPSCLEFRFEMGFPAKGRTILREEMEILLNATIPNLVKQTLFYKNWSPFEQENLKRAINLCDNQYAIRQTLEEKNLLAFIADGAILPRKNGISDLPMTDAIPFSSVISHRVTMKVPHGKPISGMAFPKGITTIVGGGYHGKSTLLKALEQGVYSHIEGDGREYVITIDDAMKIRAEDGRFINHTNISMFINHLPTRQDTRNFCTENASGSTSQAANLIEAMETGSRLLFIDEDTSATNFMVRDQLMSSLIRDEKDPITPLIHQIRSIFHTFGVSFMIAGGSCGEYFGVSDYVFQMDDYKLYDVTKKAHSLYRQYPVKKWYDAKEMKPMAGHRVLHKKYVPIFLKVKSMGTDTIIFDREAIDVRYLEQLGEPGQTTGLGYVMAWIFNQMPKTLPIKDAVDLAVEAMDHKGFLEIIGKNSTGSHPLRPRRQEIHACLNRFRSLQIENMDETY